MTFGTNCGDQNLINCGEDMPSKKLNKHIFASLEYTDKNTIPCLNINMEFFGFVPTIKLLLAASSKSGILLALNSEVTADIKRFKKFYFSHIMNYYMPIFKI